MSKTGKEFQDTDKWANYEGNPGKYTEKDAARDTHSSLKEVNAAWHQARVDAQACGELPERAAHKAEQAGGKK